MKTTQKVEMNEAIGFLEVIAEAIAKDINEAIEQGDTDIQKSIYNTLSRWVVRNHLSQDVIEINKHSFGEDYVLSTMRRNLLHHAAEEAVGFSDDGTRKGFTIYTIPFNDFFGARANEQKTID